MSDDDEIRRLNLELAQARTELVKLRIEVLMFLHSKASVDLYIDGREGPQLKALRELAYSWETP